MQKMPINSADLEFDICVALSLGSASEAGQRIKGPGTLDASPGEFPYLAKIKIKATNQLIGSGILLRSKVVLLNGYNYLYMNWKPSDIKVVLGAYDRRETSNNQEIDVETIKINPELIRSNGTSGDVALLKLAKEPKLGKKFFVKTFGVQNIISSDADEEILGDSDKCVVPGFGLIEWNEDETTKKPRNLKKFIPQMKKQRHCAKVAGEAYLRKHYLCAINEDLTAVCLFDGGSPLLCKKNGKMKLYGLTIGGTQYCSAGLSFFARTFSYYKWIKRNAKSLQG